jgi:hypothetical protein
MKCVSDASGDVTGHSFKVQGGDVYALTYIPETGCSDDWDVTIKAKYAKQNGDSFEIADILGGQGANLSNSTDGGWVNLSAPFPIVPGSTLTPIVDNLGNAQTVWIILNIWEEIH